MTEFPEKFGHDLGGVLREVQTIKQVRTNTPSSVLVPSSDATSPQ